MTEHSKIIMYHEDRRLKDKELLKKILSHNQTAVLVCHDDPYPYAVPMNYGYEWEDRLVIYLHMAVRGHRIELLEKDPKVAVNIYEYLDRRGYKPYRNENHDYRSINVFGTASIIHPDEDPEEFLKGLNILQKNNGRPEILKITDDMRRRLLVLKVTADEVTGKAQYPIENEDEIFIPEREERN